MAVLILNCVEDTSLWKHLKSNFQGNDKGISESLAINLQIICKEAYERMKAFPSLHPEYTLHDEVHCLRVTELMYKIIPQSVIEALNPIEIALLILSAHFHDQGMVLDAGEIEALNTNSDFIVFKDNWILNHPNLQNVKQVLKDKHIGETERNKYKKTEQELEAALLTDYIRITHGQRSSDFVRNKYNHDLRWTAIESSLVEFVARLSLSHVKSAYDLTVANGFRHDEVIGTYRVNLVYLGLILRLADILDFDRDRTPDSLYRTIDFRSKVSLSEWEKHRSVNGWVIDSTKIQFTMICEHPEYQRAAYQFMDWIDKELADAQDIIRNFPAEVSDYKLELPRQVDRSRIEPKDQSYVYYDLEFSLSRDEIIKLLMTEKLYGSAHLAIRELLQNSLDALRHRKAQIKRDSNADWNDGNISFEHYLDEHGHENIRCIDNGVGMDRDIILRFLTNAGRSYYRSPEFEQERVRFKQAGVDFDPCAQFGIGFMSCFMLGDRIVIHTRRDYGQGGYGEPLIIEINGFNSMVVIRKGDNYQPIGTTINITGRKLPRGFEYWNDKVHLIEVLNGYALATEFPINGKVDIPEIKNETNITPEIVNHPTFIEYSEIKSYISYKQDFSEIHNLLSGSVVISFLTDEKGLLTLKNADAEWQIKEKGSLYGVELFLLTNAKEVEPRRFSEGQTCLDGILVCGDPGRADKKLPYRLGSWSNSISLGRSSFILDIRGQIKPPLTPARNPPDSSRDPFSRNKRWSYIQKLALRAQGRIWEKVAEQLSEGLEQEIFWTSVIINDLHDINVDRMRAGKIWELISVPLVNSDDTLEWINISNLGKLALVDSKLQFQDGRFIDSIENLDKWLHNNSKTMLSRFFKDLALLMSTVVVNDKELFFEMRPPNDIELIPAESYISSAAVLPYDGNISNLLSAQSEFNNVNRAHPLVQLALKTQSQENKSPLEEFAANAPYCLSDVKLFEEKKDYNRLRWERNVGYMYQDVDWNGISEELKPPYLIRKVTGEIAQITDEDFNNWANIHLKSEN